VHLSRRGITRRSFLRGAALGTLALPLGAAAQPAPVETLYNGIRLGRPWPPRYRYPADAITPAPFLLDPPAVVPIDVGRQLFVDDFLIADTNLTRTFHRAEYHPASPVLHPEQPWELADDHAERTNTPPNPAAMVYSDGVFFDPADRTFKMWYMAGYLGATCLALSDDGITWSKPALDAHGTNIVSRANRDSSTVWLDQFETDPRKRFKMSNFYNNALVLSVSPDGVHWTETAQSGPTFDRSTFFYNPFRKVWSFSLRDNLYGGPISGRYRRYWETPRFEEVAGWGGRPPVAWMRADSRDVPRAGVADACELYNLDCVAYESVMLGLFTIWRGEPTDREKFNDVCLGFSRDGFHWHRPDRRSFLPISDVAGSWNYANVQSAGGGCVVVGDQLYFYMSGRQGRPGTGLPGVCATGLATLRRDGFASMDWLPNDRRAIRRAGDTGQLTTRPVRFSGKHLWVNAEINGELRAEVLDRDGRVIPPFARERCTPVIRGGTRVAVQWPDASLDAVAGAEVRLRFTLTDGRLYSFWVSRTPAGESGGYPAAGGPGFTGPIDSAA
jgi:hypothetical protein